MYNSETLTLRNTTKERSLIQHRSRLPVGDDPARVLGFGNGTVSPVPAQWYWYSLTHSLQISNSILQVWEEAQGKQSVCICLGGRGMDARRCGESEWKPTNNRGVTRHSHAILFIDSRILCPRVRRHDARWSGPLCDTAWAPRGLPRLFKGRELHKV